MTSVRVFRLSAMFLLLLGCGDPGGASLSGGLRWPWSIEGGSGIEVGTRSEDRLALASDIRALGQEDQVARERIAPAVRVWRDAPQRATAFVLAKAYFPEYAAGEVPVSPSMGGMDTIQGSMAAGNLEISSRGRHFRVWRTDEAPASTRIENPGALSGPRADAYVVLESGADAYRIQYTVLVPEDVVAIHDAGEYLELLTAGGQPALRAHYLVARDSTGVSRPGAVRVRGVGPAVGDGVARSHPIEEGQLIVEMSVDVSGMSGPIVLASGWSSPAALATARTDAAATLLPSGKLLVAGGMGVAGSPLGSAELYDPITGTWSSTGGLQVARSGATVTLLPSGKVLVAGGQGGSGPLSSAELYDPDTRTWSSAGAMGTARSGHTATLLLSSGKVLVVGGHDGTAVTGTAELYDPATGTWTSTALPLGTARQKHTATLLFPSGQVLVAGGSDGTNALDSAELYDPATRSWSPATLLNVARASHTATLLPSGQVLIAGGEGASGALTSAEFYDPATDGWTLAASMSNGRKLHTATLLPSGQMAVIGGQDSSGVLISSEVYNPGTNTWAPAASLLDGRASHMATLLSSGRVLVLGGSNGVPLGSVETWSLSAARWSTSGSMVLYRRQHTLTVLPSGKVLAAGGYGNDSTATAEVYDPANGTWTATGSMALARYGHTATLLPTGRVLVVGYGNGTSGWEELYDPATGTWSITGSMAINRKGGHTATLLPSGKVLVAGGYGYEVSPTTAELYDPYTGTWGSTGTMSLVRSQHTATLLPSGKVLVVGGQITPWSETSSAELYDPVAGTWTQTGSMAYARHSHRATLLPSGQVLVVGGSSSNGPVPQAELYNPATGRWSPTGSPVNAANTLLLPSGKVFMWRGGTSPAELYDPVAGTWESVSQTPSFPRVSFTATLLPSGQVLVAGGGDSANNPYLVTEIFDELGAASGSRPVVTSPSVLFSGQPFTASGSGFRGISEASGGGTSSSPTDYPLVRLTSLDSGRVAVLPSSSFSSNAVTSRTPAVPGGHYLLSVTANAIPGGRVVRVRGAPVAYLLKITTAEDTAVSFTLAADDPDADLLTYSVVSPPANGTLSGTAPNLVYRPAQDFNGTDAFTWKANDGSSDSNVVAVQITVTPVNDPPVAQAQSVTTEEDTPVSVTLQATDADGEALMYTVVSPPAHGTLSGTPPNLVYRPNPDYNGTDSFSFKASDGTQDSNVVTVSLIITPVNDAPVAQDLTLSTPEDTQLTATLIAIDVDGDALTFSVVTPPAHGTLTWVPPNGVVYQPDHDYSGPDSFTYKAHDGVQDSNVATVTVTVTPVNDSPIAQNLSYSTTEDTPIAVQLSATDLEGSLLTYAVVTSPQHGSLSGTAPNLTYLPDPDFNGTDAFAYRVNDGTSDSNVATVTLTVTPVNDAPVALSDSIRTFQDTAVAITLFASDVDGDSLTYAIVAGPTHGTLSGTGPTLSYTPAPGYTGTDSFTWKVNDGSLDSNLATISILVRSANSPPVAQDRSATTAEDQPVSILLVAIDLDGDPLTYTLVTPPAHGTVSWTPTHVTYTPAADYNGNDSFTYKASDGLLDSNVATVSISVTPVNDAPIAQAQAMTTSEDTPASFTLSAVDVDGDILTYSVIDGPAHGTISGTPGNLVYTPEANYHGSDSFTFKADDGALSSAATVSITVEPVNDAPVAEQVSAITVRDMAIPVQLVASDVDGDALLFKIVTPPAHGSLSGSGAQLTYIPALGFDGNDTFTYLADDGSLASNVAPVFITVRAVNGAPTVPQPTAPIQGERVTPGLVTLYWTESTDPDGDPILYRIELLSDGGESRVLESSTTSVTAELQEGSWSWRVEAVDALSASSGFSASATFNVRRTGGCSASGSGWDSASLALGVLALLLLRRGARRETLRVRRA